MTKLENNINNLCVENMGIYGCKHAVKEHVWTGKAHMIAKLKKNVKCAAQRYSKCWKDLEQYNPLGKLRKGEKASHLQITNLEITDLLCLGHMQLS